MGRTYKQLSLEERCALSRLHEDGKAIRQIAAIMGRSASTISRELKRGSGASVGYKPTYADELAWARRWSGQRLERQPALREAVLRHLAMGWSPEQVAGRLALEHGKSVISHESIYRFIYAQIRRSDDFNWRHYLPRAKFKRGFRGRKGGSSAIHICQRTSIAQRPAAVQSRVECGHWEADLMLFSDKKSNLMVMQERQSRFVLLALQKDKKAQNIVNNQVEILQPLPPELRKTVTNDNGTEFAYHYQLADLGIQTYFCDPHKPWQKGGVENMNGRIRRFLPVNTCINSISQNDIRILQNNLNNTPRKCLDYLTPQEVFNKALHFKCESTFPPSRE